MVRDVNRGVAGLPGCSAGVSTRVPGLHKNTSTGEDTCILGDRKNEIAGGDTRGTTRKS
jgi:hypothetical protein